MMIPRCSSPSQSGTASRESIASALSSFPILQKAVLLNPLVYASEGFRGTLVPQFPHLPLSAVVSVLLICDVVLVAVGLRRFQSKAVS